MAGSQRVYKQRIKSTQSLKKMFRAQELIAASRIGKARDRTAAAAPYARAITRAVSAVATHTTTQHPLTSERTDTNRVAVLVVASDRGMAGAYSASIIRETERLVARRPADGKQGARSAAGPGGLAAPDRGSALRARPLGRPQRARSAASCSSCHVAT